MIYTVCIGHKSPMRNWSSERQGKTKEKSKQPCPHTKEVALYQLKSSSIRNLKPDLYFFLSQDGLYSISMQKIRTKKLMNKRYCIGINWHSLKFEANTFLLYYIFMPVLFTFKIYRVNKIRKTLEITIQTHLVRLNLLGNK